MTVPAQPKIYHIVHVDRLRSILADEHLWCDAEVVRCRSGAMQKWCDGHRQELRLAWPTLSGGDSTS